MVVLYTKYWYTSIGINILVYRLGNIVLVYREEREQIDDGLLTKEIDCNDLDVSVVNGIV